MFNFNNGFDVNPIQTGPFFMTAWQEDAENQIFDICKVIKNYEGSAISINTLDNYLQGANLPNYNQLPDNLVQIINTEFVIL